MFNTFNASFSFGRRKKKIASFPTLPSGLSVHLKTAPTSGLTWTDDVGAYSATITGTPTYGSNYIGLNNTSYIYVNYNLVPPFTLSLVASFNPTTYPAVLWGNETYSQSQGYWAFFTAQNTLKSGACRNEANYGLLTSYDASYSQSNVNMYDWVYSNNGTFDLVDFYVNKQLLSSGTNFPPSGGVNNNGIIFNARHTNGGAVTPQEYNVGNYYNIEIYNTALTSTDITNKYDGLKPIYNLP